MRLFAAKVIIAAIALSCALKQAGATEKYWIAHEAQIVVIGTYHHRWTYPWFDGWHVSGTLDVDEVLFGRVLTHQIEYKLVCRWDAMCRTWPPPPIADWFGEKRIWFLRMVDSPACGPPGAGGIDPGFRSIDQRQDFEAYIRRYKH